MTKTYRKQYYLKCGSMEKQFGSKKPTYLQTMMFAQNNEPTNNEVTLEEKLIKVPTLPVSKPGRQAPLVKRWLK